MTLQQKVRKAVNEVKRSAHPFSREQYEDNYDGFTHSTYSGLEEQVLEELEAEGYGEKTPYSTVLDFTYELF